MAKFGATPINDATRPRPQVAYRFDGEARIDKRPYGKVERFIDRRGNVVNLQLAADGNPNPQEWADKLRARFHRAGFVEHAKCPVRHGVSAIAEIAPDFEELPEELAQACGSDSKTMVRTSSGLEAQRGCPHVEWLISSRREKATLDDLKTNAAAAARDKLEAEKNELARVQLEIAKEELEARRDQRRKGKRSSES